MIVLSGNQFGQVKSNRSQMPLKHMVCRDIMFHRASSSPNHTHVSHQGPHVDPPSCKHPPSEASTAYPNSSSCDT